MPTPNALPNAQLAAPVRHVAGARGRIFLAGGLVAVAVLVAYLNSFSVPFVFDDVPAILENPTIRHLGALGDVLGSRPEIAGLPVDGRPLVNLSLAINHAISGTSVGSYHAVNLVIHLLAGLALLGVVRRTLLQPTLVPRFGPAALPLALAVAAIWTVHPLQTESVTYTSQRAESLMGLLYLTTLYCFIRGLDGPRARLWHALAVAACLLGMASKEVMVSAPLMVLLYDYVFVTQSFRESLQQRWRCYAGLAATWILLGYLVSNTGDRNGTAGFAAGVSWFAYALTQTHAIAHYLWLAVWPSPLILDYGAEVARSAAAVAPYLAFLVLLVAGTVAAVLRRPALGFAGVFFLAVLAPTSSVLPIANQTMAEHRMYLPLAAAVTLAVLGLHAAIGTRRLAVCAALVVGLGGITARRNHDYRSALRIWSDTVAKQPAASRAHHNLAIALARIPGRVPEAVAHYEEALRIEPNFAEAHNNLATVLQGIPGRRTEALAHYEEALRIKPDYAEAHGNLATILQDLPGRLPEAMAHYAQALRVKPAYPDAHYNLANQLAKDPPRRTEAIAHYREALRLQPDFAKAHNNLATELAKIPGRQAEALAHFAQAVRIQPDFAAAHSNLATELARIPGRVSEALAHYEEALRLQPEFAEAHYRLAVQLAKIPGRQPEALAHFGHALRIAPDFAAAHFSLANELAAMPGRLPDALVHFEEALRIEPNFAEAHNNLANELAKIPGRQSEAIPHYEEALRLRPEFAEAHYNLANELAKSPALRSAALAHYAEALRLKPDYAEAHDNIAAVHVKLGNLDEAIRHLEQALQINPADALARANLEKIRAARK